MKKLVLLATAGLLTMSAANAQVRLGLLGGVTANNQLDHYQGETSSNQLKVGFNVGGVADIGLGGNWSLQPGLLYVMKGGQQERSTADVSEAIGVMHTEVKDKLSLSYVEMPLLVKYKFNSGLMLGVGPYAAVCVDAHTTYDYKVRLNGQDADNLTQKGSANLNIGDDSNDQIHRFDFGATGMIGYQMSNGWFLRGAVDLGMTNIVRSQNTNGFANSQPNTTTADPVSKNISYLFSVGYMF